MEADRSNDEVFNNIKTLGQSLEQMEKAVLKRPIRPDPNFSDKFLDMFFARLERELVMLREIPNGYFSFSVLAPSFQYYGNLGKNVDDAIKEIAMLGATGEWNHRQVVLDTAQVATAHGIHS